MNSFFTSLVRDHIHSLHLTAGKGLVGTGHALSCTSLSTLGHGSGSQLIPQLPKLLQGGLTLQVGLQREQGQRQSFICLGSTQTPWT